MYPFSILYVYPPCVCLRICVYALLLLFLLLLLFWHYYYYYYYSFLVVVKVMELDSIKMQLRELRRYYEDDTKSDDDIIYSVYNWVKGAHVVAQLLLLEGRFPELRRCLDLCRYVLHEEHAEEKSSNHGGGSGGDGIPRKVISSAVGEDRLLMDSLLVRTSQLQKQYEEARSKSKGRDTQYYMNKLLPTNKKVEGFDGTTNKTAAGKQREPSPPERGVSFGRRTRLNRWKVPPVLPPLVTEVRPFFRRVVDTSLDEGSDARSMRFWTQLRMDATSTSSSLETRTCSPQSVPYGDLMRDGPLSGAFETTAVSGESENIAESVQSTPPPPPVLSASAMKAPVQKKFLRQSGMALPGGYVRPLSAGIATSMLPSGDVEYHLVNNVDAHAMRAALAIKSASEVQGRSVAVMQSLTNSARQLIQKEQEQKEQQQDQVTLTKPMNSVVICRKGSEQRGDNDNSSEHARRRAPSCNSFSVVGRTGRRRLSSRRVRGVVLSSLNSPATSGCSGVRSIDLNTSETTNTSVNVVAETPEESKSACVLPLKKESFCLGDLYPQISQDARRQLEEIYENYKGKNEELLASMRVMYRKVRDHGNLFKSHEQVVLVEDTAVWKARRRQPATGLDRSVTAASSISELGLSTIHTVDSKGTSNISGGIAADSLPAPLAVRNTTPSGGIMMGSGVAPSTEGSSKLNEWENVHVNMQEWENADRRPKETGTATGDGRVVEESVSRSPGYMGIGETSSTPNCLLTKCVSPPLSPAELRLARLKASTHVAFPDVHEVVVRRTTKLVEQERRFMKVGTATSSSQATASWSSSSSLKPIRSAVNSFKSSQLLSKNMSTKTSEKDLVAQQLETSLEPASDTRSDDKDEEDKTIQKPLLIEEPYRWISFVLRDAGITEMNLSIILATIRVQSAFRCFLARRERQRRVSALEENFRSMALRVKSAVSIQRVVRGWLARRQVMTILLRLGYQLDQRIAHEAISSEDAGSEGTGNNFGLSTMRQRGASCSNSLLMEKKNSTSLLSGGEFNDWSNHWRLTRITTVPRVSSKCKLYSIPDTNLFTQSATRSARLRRIQKNIACRVIFRAFREHFHKVLKRWERETHTYMNYVTGRLDFMEAFGLKGGYPSFHDRVACRLVNTDEMASDNNVSQTFSSFSSVFPLPPERVLGDVVAAWESRMEHARSSGEFMTPLHHVKLSELQRILREREEAEGLQRLMEEELRLQKEEEIQQRQRVKVDAVSMIQRCARGYRIRYWFSMQRHKVDEWNSIQHRRAELLDGSSVAFSRPQTCNGGRKFLMPLPTLHATIYSEEQPVPTNVARVIMESIYRRHPMRFAFDDEARRRRLKVVTLVQSFLRYRDSLNCLTDRYVDICATVIQRRWRIVLKRRRALGKQKRKCMIKVLRAMES
ncbi:hypothetical protein MOQ_005799 [Trypanosoma cruzi marinkellei]|uniref:IQ calmodulin-binding protein n=1 Tax=Trypanosoma cruzi marinkellei TaxID=85056 RepID=K2NNG2_TRYCR|nr:hypothetical protein MOQ_005799 [Trypanosoma cruzi marinkellei]